MDARLVYREDALLAGHDGGEGFAAYSAARLAALVNFFNTRSRFSFDK